MRYLVAAVVAGLMALAVSHVEQVLKDRPDAVVLIPADDVAMVDSVKQLNEAKIPIVLASNPLPGSFVTFVGADDFETKRVFRAPSLLDYSVANSGALVG